MEKINIRVLGGHQAYRSYAVRLSESEREIKVLVSKELDERCNPERRYGVLVFGKLSKARFARVVSAVQGAHAEQLAKWGRCAPRWESAASASASESVRWI